MIKEMKKELDVVKCTNEEDWEADLIESLDRPLVENVRWRAYQRISKCQAGMI